MLDTELNFAIFWGRVRNLLQISKSKKRSKIINLGGLRGVFEYNALQAKKNVN
jgi:hypothetical protein